MLLAATAFAQFSFVEIILEIANVLYAAFDLFKIILLKMKITKNNKQNPNKTKQTLDNNKMKYFIPFHLVGCIEGKRVSFFLWISIQKIYFIF